MSKYKGEGYSTTFNYGIRTYLRKKTIRDRTLALVTLVDDLIAIVLFKGDDLISSRCFVLSRQTSLRKAIKAQALKEYNLYKYLLYRRDLESLDGAEIMMLSDDYNHN